MPEPTSTVVAEKAVRHDRLIVTGGLIAVVVLSWAWLLVGAGMDMDSPEMAASMGTDSSAVATPMTMQPTWTLGYALLMLSMWWIMMMAMMLPSAAPMILLHARIRRNTTQQQPYGASGLFVLGYLVAWGGFSAIAVAGQYILQQTGLISTMLLATNTAFAAGILIAAGLWQLTPIKQACLRHCRSPLSFVMQHWKPGRLGAFRMGADHGLYCLGCCWFLMALLFYGGVMNLYWIGGLALFVLFEKTVPAGHWLSKLAGMVLISWGAVIVASALLAET